MPDGSSARERTQRPVSMLPPAVTTASAMASVIRALPPAITGQPTPCASTISMRPMPPVGTAVSGSMEWAAAPAMIARASGGAPAADQHGGGQDAAAAVPGHHQRVRGQAAQRLEQFRADIVGVAGHRAEQAPVGAAVGAEAGGGLGHRAGHDRGAAAVERIGELDLGSCEPDAARGQVEAPEERRRHRQRVRRPSRRRAGSRAG